MIYLIHSTWLDEHLLHESIYERKPLPKTPAHTNTTQEHTTYTLHRTLEPFLHLPIIRKLIERPILPVLNFLIMLLYILGHILALATLIIDIGRLLARGHSRMGLVRRPAWDIVHLGAFRVVGGPVSRRGVGFSGRGICVGRLAGLRG